MIGKLLGGVAKGLVKHAMGGEETKGKKDHGQIENARSKAENQARGTDWSPAEQAGYDLYKKQENPQGKPADFDALPKARRRQYVDMAKDLLGNNKQSGPAQGLAAVTDGFSPSNELKSEGKGGSGVGKLLGGLAEAFA